MKVVKPLYKIEQFMIFLLLLFVASVQVEAQGTSAPNVLKRAAEAGMDVPTLENLHVRARAQDFNEIQFTALVNPAIELAEANIPYDLILDKAFEGLAKKVPSNMLINVLEKLQNSTRQSAEIVIQWSQRPVVERAAKQTGLDKPQFHKQIITGLAKALNQDISPETIEAFMNMLSDEDLISASSPANIAASVAILPEIHATLKNPDVANQLLQRALKGGFGSNELQKLPGALKMAQNRSQLPSGVIVDDIYRQMGNGSPAAQIINNLFNGNPGGGPPEGIPGQRGRGNNGNQ